MRALAAVRINREPPDSLRLKACGFFPEAIIFGSNCQVLSHSDAKFTNRCILQKKLLVGWREACVASPKSIQFGRSSAHISDKAKLKTGLTDPWLDIVFVILVISFATFASLCISCFVQVSAKSVISNLKFVKWNLRHHFQLQT